MLRFQNPLYSPSRLKFLVFKMCQRYNYKLHNRAESERARRPATADYSPGALTHHSLYVPLMIPPPSRLNSGNTNSRHRHFGRSVPTKVVKYEIPTPKIPCTGPPSPRVDGRATENINYISSQVTYGKPPGWRRIRLRWRGVLSLSIVWILVVGTHLNWSSINWTE